MKPKNIGMYCLSGVHRSHGPRGPGLLHKMDMTNRCYARAFTRLVAIAVVMFGALLSGPRVSYAAESNVAKPSADEQRFAKLQSVMTELHAGAKGPNLMVLGACAAIGAGFIVRGNQVKSRREPGLLGVIDNTSNAIGGGLTIIGGVAMIGVGVGIMWIPTPLETRTGEYVAQLQLAENDEKTPSRVELIQRGENLLRKLSDDAQNQRALSAIALTGIGLIMAGLSFQHDNDGLLVLGAMTAAGGLIPALVKTAEEQKWDEYKAEFLGGAAAGARSVTLSPGFTWTRDGFRGLTLSGRF